MALAYTESSDVVGRRLGTTYEVVVSGDLDLAAADALSSAIAGGFSAGPETLVIDLQQVAFMDSSAIHALIGAHHRAEGTPTTLVVLRPTGSAARVFALCGAQDLFPDVARRFARPAGDRFVTEWSL